MTELGDLQRRAARHVAGPGLTRTAVPGLAIATAPTATAPDCDLVLPTFALVLRGAKRTVLNRRVFRYAAGDFLVAGAELPVTGAVTEGPFLALVMRLDPAAIAALLLQVAPASPSAPAPGGAMACGHAGPALLDAVGRMLALLDAPRDIAALAPVYEREVLWRLIAGEQGAVVRRIGVADGRLAQIARAIGWLRAHYAEALHVPDLAGECAMSVSTFNRHFRAVTAMSPLQYQKQLRLQEARALLRAGGDVAGVGRAVGYDSASQFSREYRRQFGAPPGRDAAR